MTERAEPERTDKLPRPDEQRGIVTDIAIIAGPPLGAATAWALNQFGGSDRKPAEDNPPPKK